MIAVIDYGSGNLGSMRRALQISGGDVHVTSDPAVVRSADGVVLPGVGHAGQCMQALAGLGLDVAIRDAVAAGTPFLGVCVGMQVMLERLEEGDTDGLGLVRGRVRALTGAPKIPHMGWNQSRLTRDCALGAAGSSEYYYFVHSFIAETDSSEDVAATVCYGEEFPSILMRGDVWGTQFHAEKSGDAGLRLVKAFVDLVAVRTPQTALTGAPA
jgi:glutamine amidotransferase